MRPIAQVMANFSFENVDANGTTMHGTAYHFKSTAGNTIKGVRVADCHFPEVNDPHIIITSSSPHPHSITPHVILLVTT